MPPGLAGSRPLATAAPRGAEAYGKHVGRALSARAPGCLSRSQAHREHLPAWAVLRVCLASTEAARGARTERAADVLAARLSWARRGPRRSLWVPLREPPPASWLSGPSTEARRADPAKRTGLWGLGLRPDSELQGPPTRGGWGSGVECDGFVNNCFFVFKTTEP